MSTQEWPFSDIIANFQIFQLKADIAEGVEPKNPVGTVESWQVFNFDEECDFSTS